MQVSKSKSESLIVIVIRTGVSVRESVRVFTFLHLLHDDGAMCDDVMMCDDVCAVNDAARARSK